MTNKMMNRRNLIKSTAAVSLGAALLPCFPALAKEREAVMATWGGDYSRLLGEVVQPIASRNNIMNTVFDTGGTSARRTKLIAQANRRKSTIDIVSFSDGDMSAMNAKGFLGEINKENTPSIDSVFEQFNTGYSIPHIYSALVIVYNKDLVDPPKSYSDLWNTKYEQKIGLANALFRQTIAASALAHGGSSENFDPAYKPLMELKKSGVKIFPSNEAVANAFQSGEIGVTLMWRARAYQWKKLGLPLAFSVPEEGAMPVVFEAAITKNAPNPETAHTFLNAMLDPEAQASFAERMGYIPTVKNAHLPADLAAEIGFTSADRANFFKANYAYFTEQGPKMQEWWAQKFKA